MPAGWRNGQSVIIKLLGQRGKARWRDKPRRFDAVATIVVDMQHCVGIGSVGVLKEKGVLIGGSLLR